MPSSCAIREVASKLKQLADVHDQASRLVREIAALLGIDGGCVSGEKKYSSQRNGGRIPSVNGRDRLPAVDHQTLSIRWKGRACCLGNTLTFRLFERLCRRPGQLVSHQQLLDEVWEGVRSKAAIRSVVKVLRQRLREAGMADLADAIDGRIREHYSLNLRS